MPSAIDRLIAPSQTAWEKSQNIIHSQRVRDQQKGGPTARGSVQPEHWTTYIFLSYANTTTLCLWSLLHLPLLSLTCQTVDVVFGDAQPCARQFGDALDRLDSLARHHQIP